MEFRPILSAMRRNKFGAVLIAVQMSVTLAFLVNSLSLIEQRLAHSARPTGVDEANLFVISTQPVDTLHDAAARASADVATLRSLEGVADAYITNDYPLAGGGWTMDVHLTPEQKVGSANTAYYFGDEHALGTLGVNLLAGRNFTADEIATRTDTDIGAISVVIVTKALGDKLFPGGDALGKSIYIESDTKAVRIIGILERLQTPFYGVTGVASTFAENSTIAPYRPYDNFTNYMVRSKPGQRDRVMKSAEATLRRMDSERIINIKSLSEARADAYRGDHGLVVLLSVVCIALLAITAFGIIGLTSYWVSQRRRQIGIRRALGATRQAILRYFQTENFLIAMAGASLGVMGAIALNLWMVHSFEVVRMDNSRAFVGAFIMLGLGQLAVLYPALRAASIPPALATRGG
jgi:putative ABC transport system permease protein